MRRIEGAGVAGLGPALRRRRAGKTRPRDFWNYATRSSPRDGGKPIHDQHDGPVTVIADPRLHYPHSVAFTPRTNHLIVTNAGANYFNAYAPRQGLFGTRWSPVPVSQVIAHDDAVFREVNTADKTEGGPKGVAVHGTTLAVCSPQIGIKIYSFREE